MAPPTQILNASEFELAEDAPENVPFTAPRTQHEVNREHYNSTSVCLSFILKFLADISQGIGSQHETEFPKDLTHFGFANQGNTCYFSSTLQAILHHPRAANYLRFHHIRRGDLPGRLHAHKPRHCIFCQFYELLVRYWTRDLDNASRETEINSRVKKLHDRLIGTYGI